MKHKAISSVLVMAALAPNTPALSPQKTSKTARQPRAEAQTASQRKREAIEKTARSIIADQLGLDLKEVKPQSSFVDDLGTDSLDVVELVMRFEEEFDIEIPDEDCEKLGRVQLVYDYLVAHVPRWPKPAPVKPRKQ